MSILFLHLPNVLSQSPLSMIGSPTRSAAKVCLCLAAAGFGGACADLPTGADSFRLEADGQIWTAVMPPEDLPDASTWLAYSAPDSPAASAARDEVASLQSQATRARAAGNLELANEFLTEAAGRAVAAMEVSPEKDVLLRGGASLEAWERRAREEIERVAIPGLAEAVDAVELDRQRMEAALAGGDDRLAALLLTVAAERIRDWSPQGVALRVLGRVESHLAAAARSPEERERATHLMQSARYELIDGNSLRAMQRALYALQLAGGNGLSEAPEQEHSRCGEHAC